MTELSRSLTALSAWLLALVFALSVAGSVRAQSAPSSAALAGHGTLLIAYAHTLALRDMASGVERTLFQSPSDHFVHLPRWLPDGSGFLYVDAHAYAGDQNADYGSDIWRADPDGSNRRLLLAHDSKGADIYGLSIAPDGSALYFGYDRTDFDSAGYPTGQTLQVQRVDLATLTRTLLVDQALDPAVSSDGHTLVYLNLAHADDLSFGFWGAGLDGSGAHPLVTEAQGFLVCVAPRFSPNGGALLFAAAEDGGPFGDATSEYLDGPPQDIWTVAPDGSRLTRITNIQEDQPSAAWSADGSQIAVIGQTGLYLVNADGSNITRLGYGYLHSELSWLDR